MARAARRRLVTDPVASAKAAGLTYVAEGRPGLTRRRAGRSFVYFDAEGRRVRERLIYTFLIGAEPRETQSAETAASTLFRSVSAGRAPRYKFSLLGSYCQRTGH
jgi:hypothetical protein